MDFTADVLHRLEKNAKAAAGVSKKAADKELKKIGILTPKGKLASPYRSEKPKARPKAKVA
ncbi:hypothetical protein RFM99_25825 [Mesorhizobium sp. VK4C]|uniref:hypothetical protein n=1 Tax=Mesorhizobium captivum TaxID=3072319 RepID=UPI002A23DEA9|nr:hypothetical protein [Mesorhizobium sp. VK4C]MDX8501820.1 hypothetical protein [Mesorhizobium sp. VK4C]